MTVTERIRWEPTKHSDLDGGAGGWDGKVGTLEPLAFQVWQSNCDFRDVVLGEWVLSIRLPGPLSEQLPHGHDPEALKAEAEKWLDRFVSSLGAVFPAEPAKSRAWHTDWAVVDRDQDGNAILRHKPTGGRYKILPVEEC